MDDIGPARGHPSYAFENDAGGRGGVRPDLKRLQTAIGAQHHKIRECSARIDTDARDPLGHGKYNGISDNMKRNKQ
jgi:hypothetical protein